MMAGSSDKPSESSTIVILIDTPMVLNRDTSQSMLVALSGKTGSLATGGTTDCSSIGLSNPFQFSLITLSATDSLGDTNGVRIFDSRLFTSTILSRSDNTDAPDLNAKESFR